ncbi:flagellar biosynthetic protein FliO [Naasia lichenicola]|uniref:Flagellar protein n=1 Tax=Naasia lichenicola TaxID=2565933 RepID=A0A4S4FKI4_9MICO|nr:flagellar biosynthetic protein FliO [Naasia lichenicola]THG29686.1 flagellar biosynthetic protein FliO [Naasia lichenicola]
MDTVFLALRVIISLGAVLGAIWFLHRWLTKGNKSPAKRAGKAITVVARQSLGAKASVAVIETQNARFLLGVTEQSVTILDRIDIEVAETTVIEIPTAKTATTTTAADASATARAVAEFADADFAEAERAASAAADRAAAQILLPAPPALATTPATATSVPIVVPAPVASFEQALSEARAAGARQQLTGELSIAEARRPLTAPIPLLPATRRALREAEAAQATASKATSSKKGGDRKSADPKSTGRKPSAEKAQDARTAEKKSPIAGSILSPDTWRQTAEALRRAR